MIIAIAGGMRSGKDTCTSFLIEEYPEFSKVAFADPIKNMVCSLFNISREELETNKDIPLYPIPDEYIIQHVESNYPSWSDYVLKDYSLFKIRTKCAELGIPLTWSLRDFMTSLGNKWGRSLMYEGFWADIAMSNRGLIAISDLRLPIEYKEIIKRNGLIIYIKRPFHLRFEGYTENLTDPFAIPENVSPLLKKKLTESTESYIPETSKEYTPQTPIVELINDGDLVQLKTKLIEIVESYVSSSIKRVIKS